MDLSIIIVNYNSGDLLGKCLQSLEKHARGLLAEICVVDNASSDGSLSVMRDFKNVKTVQLEKNVGFAAALNRGLSQTSGEFVLWLNPDAELMDDRLPDFVAWMRGHERVGIAGPQILNPDGTLQLSCRAFPSYETALFNRYSFLTRLWPGNPWSRRYLQTDRDHGQERGADWVSGACLLHRRKMIETIGPLDEKFFMYCEDVDFCLRAQKAGWKIFYWPGMRVIHRIGGSSEKVFRPMILEHHRSMWRYYQKHMSANIFQDLAVGSAIFFRMLMLLALSFIGPGKKRRPI